MVNDRGKMMKAKVMGVEYTPSSARLLLSYTDSHGMDIRLSIILPTDRVLKKADIMRVIKEHMVNLAIIQKRIQVAYDLMGTEIELPDTL